MSIASNHYCTCGWPTYMHQDDSGCQIPYQDSLVHVAHCCSKHGCKYAEATCPVQASLLPQEFPCEDCDLAAESLAGLLAMHERHMADDENAPLRALHSWIYQKDARIVELEERVQAYEIAVGKLLYALDEEAGPIVVKLRALLDEGRDDV